MASWAPWHSFILAYVRTCIGHFVLKKPQKIFKRPKIYVLYPKGLKGLKRLFKRLKHLCPIPRPATPWVAEPTAPHPPHPTWRPLRHDHNPTRPCWAHDKGSPTATGPGNPRDPEWPRMLRNVSKTWPKRNRNVAQTVLSEHGLNQGLPRLCQGSPKKTRKAPHRCVFTVIWTKNW